MTIRETPLVSAAPRNASRNFLESSRSGAANATRNRPAASSVNALCVDSLSSPTRSPTGPAPASASRRAWSRSKARNGASTTVVPGDNMAARWKTSDLPAPVGMVNDRSRPDSSAAAASACPGRRPGTPNRRRASDANAASSRTNGTGSAVSSSSSLDSPPSPTHAMRRPGRPSPVHDTNKVSSSAIVSPGYSRDKSPRSPARSRRAASYSHAVSPLENALVRAKSPSSRTGMPVPASSMAHCKRCTAPAATNARAPRRPLSSCSMSGPTGTSGARVSRRHARNRAKPPSGGSSGRVTVQRAHCAARAEPAARFTAEAVAPVEPIEMSIPSYADPPAKVPARRDDSHPNALQSP